MVARWVARWMDKLKPAGVVMTLRATGLMSVLAGIVLLGYSGCTEQPGDTSGCEEGDATYAPGGTELCIEANEGCSRTPSPAESDRDGDGISACAGDCDDADGENFPGNTESCDEKDNDCSGAPDSNEVDNDLDGSLACGGDCDDDDAENFPGNPERCDGQDNDCDGEAGSDELDEDNDKSLICEGDCDDSDAKNFPGNIERCDGQDNNCDGNLSSPELDADDDGLASCSGDCDDADPDVYEGNAEQCDGKDNDCDGSVPSAEIDLDGDGLSACTGDCSDSDANNYPGNQESCDGQDNNCNGDVDEGTPDANGHYFVRQDDITPLEYVGGPGGAEFVARCPCGVAIGIAGDTANWLGYSTIARFSMLCAALNGDGSLGSVSATSPVGSFTEGTAFTGTCPAGEVLVGQNASANNYVAVIGAQCAPVQDVLDSNVTVRSTLGPFTDTTGVPGGALSTEQCPPGTMVIGTRGRQGMVLDAVGFECQAFVYK